VLTAGSSDLPNDYVIGPEDVLTVVFWQDSDLSRDVVVRPDGHISLPLFNDVRAAGLTPEQLRDKLATQALRFVEDATVTVIVKEVRSPKVFITGEVMRPGLYPLNAPTTVLQLIATAGGLQEYARSGEINVVRTEAGRTTFLPFNYKEIMKKKNLQQNITLKAGDTVVVP
jgi:polysaccharide export outer membrane protein